MTGRALLFAGVLAAAAASPALAQKSPVLPGASSKDPVSIDAAKLDYFDKELKFGSENPADPSKTTRVLTIMLAEEY